MIHSLLERQIRRLKRKHPDGELDIGQLLELVSTTYAQLDEERQKKDRYVGIMSEEMTELNRISMARHEAYVSTLVEKVVDGVITLGADLRVAKVNASAQMMLGANSDDLIGLDFLSLFSKPDGEPICLKCAIEDSEGFQDNDIIGQRLNGEPFSAELSVSKVSQGDEESFFLVIIRDVSKWKETEKMLIDAKETAEAAADSKSEFLSTMSHEIRTPLNAVIGMTGLLSDTGLSEEQVEYVNTIKTGGEALLSIINDILDFSKIESQKLDLEILPVPTIDPIEDVMDLLVSKAHKKQIDLMYDIDPSVPSMIETDITRLRQVLVNLVGNAIKFTDKGQVLVKVSSQEIEPNRHQLLFEVIDTGIGIPPERVDRLFKSFSQVDASTTRKYGGSGLGLAICKGIVEALGGRIWVEKESGGGSSFNFTFESYTSNHQNPIAKDLISSLTGKKVLVLDDNEVNLRILDRQLSSWGMEVTTESVPHTALKKLRGGLAVDLVISDYRMPILSGEDFVERLRGFAPKEELPVIIFSSGIKRVSARVEPMINGSLTKPGRQETLLKTVAKVLGTLGGHIIEEHTGNEREQFPKLKVLLVEDNSVNQKVALRMLSKMGIEADVAGNGLEAVEIASQIKYDMILMDMMMPVMDGLEATVAIRKQEVEGSHRPIIIAMTANAMKEDVVSCREAGMNDFLSKPVRLEKLEQTIWNWCQVPS